MKHAKAPKKISYCVTSRNRLWQLQQTLSANLSHLTDDEELTLVDFGSTDGLSTWVWQEFESALGNKLNFFELKNDVEWSSPKAKNLAHRLSNGQYLFNLDADNFVTTEDLRGIHDAHDEGVVAHQWSGDWPDGSYGRIGLPQGLFFNLGGYNKSLLPMGGQDMDIIMRAEAYGAAKRGWGRQPASRSPTL